MCPYPQTSFPAASQGSPCRGALPPLPRGSGDGPWGSLVSWERLSCVLAGWGSRCPHCRAGCSSSSKANKVENRSSLRLAELETEPPLALSKGSVGAAPGSERGAAPCPLSEDPCPGHGPFCGGLCPAVATVPVPGVSRKRGLPSGAPLALLPAPTTGMGSDLYWVRQTLDVPWTHHRASGSPPAAGLTGSHGLTVAPSLLPRGRGDFGEPGCSP